MSARVLLFNPPDRQGGAHNREGRCTQERGIWGTLWPPVTLATAAALLERDGHVVRVVDFPALGKGPGFLAELLRRDRPDLVFWAVGTPTLGSDLSLAREVRRWVPGAFTGVLGTHVSALPGPALGCGGGGEGAEGGGGGAGQGAGGGGGEAGGGAGPGAGAGRPGRRSISPEAEDPGRAFPDVVVRGEPERVIRELCARPPQERLSVRGISFRDPASGRAAVHNPDAGFLEPGEIPAPAWHRLDPAPAYRLPLRGARFLVSAPVRGCPYACSFCTAPLYYGRKVRKRPVESVIAELRDGAARHGLRDFFFWADTFTVDRGYVLRLCEAMGRAGLGISWSCNSRVDTVDAELLAAMKRAGLWMISFGIESASPRVLESCGKGITAAQSVRAVETARGLGIRTAGHFLFGLPGETVQSMRETLRLSLALPLDVAQYYAAAPFPGTALHRQAVENGWLCRGAGDSQARAGMDLPGLPGREVDAFRRRAYRAFYARPGVAAGLLGMMRPAGAALLLRNAWGFVRQAML